jgi:hypothetical protein
LVLFLMTGIAPHADYTLSVSASRHGGKMRLLPIGLTRHITGRMTVYAAGTAEHRGDVSKGF